MKVRTGLLFLFQTVTVGLALAFVLLLIRPDWFNFEQSKVQIVEGSGAPAANTAGPGPDSYAGAVSAAAPSVVNINTRKVVTRGPGPLAEDPLFRHFFGEQEPRERLENSLGSGVIVSPQGYVLTNNHVIDGADAIQITLKDGRTADAQVVGTDPESDLAVLKVQLPELPAITFGRSDALTEGDVVLAIGNPFGVGQTVTMGIVSATGRKGLGLTTFENFIQTDAAINPGNSGGALINSRGELVGINTAIFSRTGGYQGIGFAIPVSLARGIMTQIIESGRVRRGWLGVEIQELSPELARSFGLDSTDGALIAGVLPRGPGASAGLRVGDVITEIEGKKVKSVRDALDAIASQPPGSELTIRGVRGGEPFELEPQVAERPTQPGR